MYCMVLSTILFSNWEWMWWWSIFKNLHACGYQVPSSVETGWSPYFSTILDRKRSATNIFLSFEMLIPRISLFLGSIATHNQMYSEPALMIVSSRTYSSMFFFFDDILWGLYFWIQFQIDRNVISSDKTSKPFRGSS